MDKFGTAGWQMRRRRRRRHFDQESFLNKEVHRHVRQRWRRRLGGSSVQSQLEVQQIDTFDSGDTFGSDGGGHGQGH